MTKLPGTDASVVHGQVERVERLLAAVRDIVSSLGATSAQLEREVAQALRATTGGDGAGDGRGTSSADVTGGTSSAGGTGGAATPHGSSTSAPSAPTSAHEAQRVALVEAVEHRAVIEQARGMLMLKHRCDAEAAFELLVEISRRERRKVREIATDLVRAGSGPTRPLVVDLTEGGRRTAGAARA